MTSQDQNISSFRENQSVPINLEDDPSIIPNVLLPEIPLLETVLNLRNENLTDRILDKKDFNFSKVDQALKETSNISIIKFKKYEQV